MSAKPQCRVLYIEDDPGLARLVQIDLGRRGGYDVETVDRAAEGLRRLALSRFDVVALDHNLPDSDGIEVIRDILAMRDPPPIVYVTGADDSRTAVAAMKSGAIDYVIKQPENGTFFELLSAALQAAVDQAELRHAKNAAEHALRENERRLTLAMDAGDFGDWLICALPDRTVVSGSDRFWNHLGLLPAAHEERAIPCLMAHVHEEDRASLNAALAEALSVPQNFSLEIRIQGAEKPRWVELRGQNVGAEAGSMAPTEVKARIVGVSIDVTERKAAEAERLRFTEMLEQRVAEEMEAHRTTQAELVQAQKMEAVGQLTGGVAHDFNNLLTVVIGNLELIQLRAKTEADQRSVLGAMRAAERAAELTRQLLAFSRKQHLAVKAIDVNELVSAMDDLLARSIGALVRIERVVSPNLWKVLADPSQLELSILNLSINARDAMPLGGTLQITTANIGADAADRPSEIGSDGEYVMIAVSDTGSGMPRDVQQRAFEPFFTTKEVGKGSGLGLSMVYGFVKQSGGAAVIESVMGRGTTVKLFLPCAPRSTVAGDDKPSVPTLTLSAKIPSAHVLVVDDDTAVREFVHQALEAAGHKVISVGSGLAALELLTGAEAPIIDLLLADFSMPQMDGSELIRRVRETVPAIRTLMMTGYADGDILTTFEAGMALAKPFKLHELSAAVEKALEGCAGSQPASSNIIQLPQVAPRAS